MARANALAAERKWVPEEATYDDDPADEPQRKGRSPWTWPLIALILLLLFALVGFFLSQRGILFPSEDPTSAVTTSSVAPSSASPTRTSQSATPTQTRSTPTPTSEPTQELVNVIPAAYLGKDYRQVQADLAALGLAVTVVPQESTADAPGRVLELNPTGAVPEGTAITVVYAVAPEPEPTTSAPVPAPTAAPTTSSVAAPALESPLPDCTDGQQPGTPPTCNQ
ncbi:PASTA domain-containing protein [Pseudarthrobacter sp. NKDBFgelt]|uniref:PASTA domain-containing protein n=1 Tax=Pseudarthrobacter sp. NKDBFgelt TaxID=3384443 RepID=UPI0038D50C9F